LKNTERRVLQHFHPLQRDSEVTDLVAGALIAETTAEVVMVIETALAVVAHEASVTDQHLVIMTDVEDMAVVAAVAEVAIHLVVLVLTADTTADPQTADQVATDKHSVTKALDSEVVDMVVVVVDPGTPTELTVVTKDPGVRATTVDSGDLRLILDMEIGAMAVLTKVVVVTVAVAVVATLNGDRTTTRITIRAMVAEAAVVVKASTTNGTAAAINK